MGIFETVLEFIGTHGLATFIYTSVVFLLMAFHVYVFKSRRADKLYNQKLLDQVLNDREDKHHEEEKVAFSAEIKNVAMIQEKLTELRAMLDADVITIYEFHNGIKKKSGIPFNKFSATFEKQKANSSITSGLKEFKDLPISMLWYFSKELYDNGSLAYVDVNDMAEYDTGTCNILKDKGIESIYSTAIYNGEGSFVGWISVEFTKQTALTNHQMTEYDKMVRIINGYLF